MARNLPPEETKWKKGDPSPNPSGKPKGTLSFKTIIKRWMAAEMDEENPETGQKEKMTLADIITLKQFQKAKRGDTRAFEVLKNHIESLPKQGIDLSNTDGTLSKEIVFKRYKKEK